MRRRRQNKNKRIKLNFKIRKTKNYVIDYNMIVQTLKKDIKSFKSQNFSFEKI